MIREPKIGMKVKLNYRDKSMPYQGEIGIIKVIGKMIKNCLILVEKTNVKVVVPRGNLNEIKPEKNLQLF